MKKIFSFVSLFVTCFIATVSAQGCGVGGQGCGTGSFDNGQDYSGYEAQQDYSYGDRGSECQPPEKPMNDCYCLYCRYVPQHYNKWHCTYEQKNNYKKCCRYVPQQYQKTCCRMVPQYYNVTCTRQVPEYYYTCQTTQVPKYTCEKCCKWIPQYYYKHVSEPTCGDRCVESCR